MTRLGTEFAIFLAVAASRIDNGTEIDGISTVFLADFISHRQKKHGVLIFGTNQFFCFFFCNFSSV